MIDLDIQICLPYDSNLVEVEKLRALLEKDYGIFYVIRSEHRITKGIWLENTLRPLNPEIESYIKKPIQVEFQNGPIITHIGGDFKGEFPKVCIVCGKAIKNQTTGILVCSEICLENKLSNSNKNVLE